jgi:RNA polymerase sigma-70 factor (ECF subfamily)
MASVVPFRSNDSVVGMDSELSALLERVAGGDRPAFAKLYDQVSGRLFGVISRILPKSELAEDALQETFVRIWQKASTYDASLASPMAWMATIAHNRAIDLKRRFAERLARRSEELDPATADDHPDPLTLAEQSENFRRLKTCLDGLPSDRQEMVLLAYHQGWSREELAARFKRPVTTVKTLLRRSLIALKECLDAA